MTGVLEGRRLLLVDDEPDALELMAEALSDEGALVHTAESAANALAALATFAPDLLVCDVSMPVRDGYDLLREIRGLPADRGGRVGAAALTGYSLEEDRARAMAAGFDLHFVKPVDVAVLARDLATLAERTSPRAR